MTLDVRHYGAGDMMAIARNASSIKIMYITQSISKLYSKYSENENNVNNLPSIIKALYETPASTATKVRH